ncbi:MAG TPA: VWA domain-containing protein, partial [Ideonella sp.]|nr:VWA domain-containing protein [Ideonella sp.]
ARSNGPTTGAGWSGLRWAGPQAGRPAQPDAADCKRAPQRIDLWGPQGRPGAAWRGRREAAEMAELSDTASPHGSLSSRSAPELAERRSDKAATSPPVAAAAAPAPEGAYRPPRPQDLPHERPATEPVTAGVVDDNADFGAYLAYRERNSGLPVRELDVRERTLLTVRDAADRPVPDAQVALYASGQPLPLWARTDAGGQVWLHPGVVDSAAPVFEVQVRKADQGRSLIGRALLRRGQRDNLQVRLAAELPAERARLDLVFLIDATGSMADEIDKLKRSMRAMADQIAQLPSKPDLCFAMVAYRDRGDEFFVRAHDFSNDLPAFQRSLGALQAGGGGDTPEALNEALHTAVHRLSWRGDGATRLVVLVADAPPHLDYGAPYYDHDMQGALARGIKLFAVGASGLDPVGEYVFRQAAQYTGGRFVFLTYAQATDPSSGPGRETVHDVGNYSVESLDKLVVRLVREELAKRSN